MSLRGGLRVVGGVNLVVLNKTLVVDDASYIAGGGFLLTRGKQVRTLSEKSGLRKRLGRYRGRVSGVHKRVSHLRRSAGQRKGSVHRCRRLLSDGVGRRRGLGTLLNRGLGRLSRHRGAVRRLRNVVSRRGTAMRDLLGDIGSTLLNFDDSRLAMHRRGNGICITVSSGLLFRSKDTGLSGHKRRTLKGLTRILGGRARVSMYVRKRASGGPVRATRFGSG